METIGTIGIHSLISKQQLEAFKAAYEAHVAERAAEGGPGLSLQGYRV